MAARAQDGASSSQNAKIGIRGQGLGIRVVVPCLYFPQVIILESEEIKAEKIALRLIARAEQCSAGLALKLEKRGHDSACISAVISRLCGLKLIDDRRFAKLWLESRLRLARSPRRLLASLCRRGIDRSDAEAVMKDVLDTETELAILERFVKKHAQKTALQGADRRREKRERSGSGEKPLKYLLKSEGFSPQAIQQFLGIE